VKQVVAEQVPAAVRLGPDLTSLAVGVNDALRRHFDVHAAATELENGVRDLRRSGSDVLVFAFGNPARRSSVMGLIRERIRAYNTAVEAIAEAYGCYQVRFWDVAAMDDDRLWADDRLHLSPAGHELAAACALEALGIGDAAVGTRGARGCCRHCTWARPLDGRAPGPVAGAPCTWDVFRRRHHPEAPGMGHGPARAVRHCRGLGQASADTAGSWRRVCPVRAAVVA
jgi:hypothetical protein